MPVIEDSPVIKELPKPTTFQCKASEHTTITISTGIVMLNRLKDTNNLDDQFLDKMLYEYCNLCAVGQLETILRHLDINTKFLIILDNINIKYAYSNIHTTTNMLYGSEINKRYTALGLF